MEALLNELAEAADAEKGDRGRVGVIAGSAEMAGPPALVGEAALRTGSDLVKVLTSETALAAVAGFSENFMVGRFTGDHLSVDSVSMATEIADWSDVLVVGPGLAKPDQEAVRRIVADAPVPVVVDADAIRPATEVASPETVFTPDAAEVSRIEDDYGSLEAFADETRAVVISKGAPDEIYDGDDRWTNETGTPAMTVGGTGDIMAGVVSSLIGQGLDLPEAARLAAWTVGTAGERATEAYGIGLMATDVVERIPEAMGPIRGS